MARDGVVDEGSDGHQVVVRAELAHLLDELDERLVVLDDLARAGAAGANLVAVAPEVVHYRRRVAELSGAARQVPASGLAGLAEVTRAMFGLVAGVEGAVEWHSPARACSGPGGVGLVAPLGSQDYQRDRCAVVGAYERTWLATCVDRRRGPCDLRALAFASGMAALTTVLAWLAAEAVGDATPAPVLVPATTYHETRMLLARGPLAARLCWVPSSATDEVLAAVARHRPAVVLFDVQANGPSLELAEVDRLLDGLAASATSGRPITVVADTTMLGVRAQPFTVPVARRSELRLLTVESLTKFAQRGLDRVAAGIVVADDVVVDVLDEWREHLGTNATAAAVRQLPRPSRRWLEDRWRRHEANASALARRLHARVPGAVARVVHPGLPGHRSHAVARRIGTTGAAVALTGPDGDGLEQAIDRAVVAARRAGVALAEGTSFGFDATRISLIRPAGMTPFLRVAPGAGPVDEMDCLASILAGALEPVGELPVGAREVPVREPEPATVAAAAAGDVVAFADLVHLFQVPVWRFLTRLLGDRALAEDVTQETFVRVHRGLPGFAGRSRFSTWVFGIARNAGLDAIRARRRRPHVVADVPPGLAASGEPGFSAELAEALASLAIERREALLLVGVLGLSYREVAEITATPEGTIKSRVHAARLQLHAALGDEEQAREV